MENEITKKPPDGKEGGKSTQMEKDGQGANSPKGV